MKKLVAVGTSLAIALSIVGCDEKSESKSQNNTQNSPPPSTLPGNPGVSTDPGGMGPGGMGPGGQNMSIPTMPGATGAPGVSVAGMPGAEIPGMPGAEIPGMPRGADVPGMPGTSLPGMPGTSLPGMPGTSLPGMPGTSTPGMPEGALPGMPGVTPGAGSIPMPGGRSPSGVTVTPGMPGSIPGMPGKGLPGMPGAEGPAGMPGAGLPGMPGAGLPGMPGVGLPGMPGVGGRGEGGGNSSPPQAEAGSAEDAVYKMVWNLSKKNYKEVAKTISPKASDSLLRSFRSGRPAANHIKTADSWLGRVKPAGEGGAKKISSSEHQVTLVNANGLLLTFVCRKVDGKFLIHSLKRRASRTRRRR